MHIPPGVTAVIGLGISGQAICRHLARRDVPFVLLDTREAPPGLAAFQASYPDVATYCGPLTQVDFRQAFEVVVSPGVDLRTPGLEGLLTEHNPATNEPRLVGEMALFKRASDAPVAAITGSNAKSTVTTLLGEMAKTAGVSAAVGGNLGTPALELLETRPEAELYILELSSFQLETTPMLGAAVAAFLNICEDHLDRHGDMTRYQSAKARVFLGAQHVVVNADDSRTWPETAPSHLARFTAETPTTMDWGIREACGKRWLAWGDELFVACDTLAIAGQHNHVNALAALAMGQALGFSKASMCQALEHFKGLSHRSEVIGSLEGVSWVNDSKGTNVGATLAAIEGIGTTLEGKLILLAGGVGKGADFTPLAAPLARYARQVIVFGVDAPRLSAALEGACAVETVSDLDEAMALARQAARPGDCVLLSPACASLDQFSNYAARGDAFRQWVAQRASEVSQ